MTKLSKKQELFCHEYIKDRNAGAAYVRAGYSENGARQSGKRLLTNAYVQQRIEELLNPIKEKCKVDTEWIIEELKSNHEEAKELGEYGNSNKSLDQLAKIIGSYAPEKIEHTVDIDSTILEARKRLKRD